MKFIKTVDLWDAEVTTKIESGELVLQRGQWVTCGGGQKSRFVMFNPASKVYTVAHGPNAKAVNQRFRCLVENIKLSRAV